MNLRSRAQYWVRYWNRRADAALRGAKTAAERAAAEGLRVSDVVVLKHESWGPGQNLRRQAMNEESFIRRAWRTFGRAMVRNKRHEVNDTDFRRYEETEEGARELDLVGDAWENVQEEL